MSSLIRLQLFLDIPLLIRDEVAVDWVVGWKVLKVTRAV